MSFFCYKGISETALNELHDTSTGKPYTLCHNEMLRVELPFLGKNEGRANSQGWERDSNKYFKLLYQAHPEMFSKKNVARIVDEKVAPIVDQKMIQYIPEWEPFRTESLIHHHIGGDGETVAVPRSVHVGSGGIHNYEKLLGITDSCIQFSEICSAQPNSIGKTASTLHSEYSSLIRSGSPKGNVSSEGPKLKSTVSSYKTRQNNALYKPPQSEKQSTVSKIIKKAARFISEHRDEIITVAKVSLTVAQAVVDVKSSGLGHTSSSLSSSGFTVDNRATPQEHSVSGYVRQQNGKAVQVKSYIRGGKGKQG